MPLYSPISPNSSSLSTAPVLVVPTVATKGLEGGLMQTDIMEHIDDPYSTRKDVSRVPCLLEWQHLKYLPEVRIHLLA